MKHQNFYVVIVASLASFISFAGTQSAHGEDAVAAAVSRLAGDVKFLADDALKGRDVGSEGIARAGELIAERFADLGFETKIFGDSPYQDFTIPGPPGLGAPEKNSLTISAEDANRELVLGENYNPLSLGSSDSFSGQLVFAGYGITAPEFGYDDFEGIDVEGKIIIVLRKEPQQNLEDSLFDGTRNSQYAYFSTKEANAAMRKAAAVIMINDAKTVASAGEDTLLPVDGGGAALTNDRIPTVFATRATLEPFVKKATGKSLTELEEAIDVDLKPQSQVLEGISVSGQVDVRNTEIPGRNVIGFLPGSGDLEDEYVVVGAHYDHVGMGGSGSLAPGTIAVHNGADDNASGTATMLEIARRMSENKSENRRSLIFMAFSAEEKGLLGSKYYARYPRWPLEDTVAMVNLDMVGRLANNTLTVYGTGTAEGFSELLDRHNTETKMLLDKREAGFGPSDHSSFYEKDVPVFHFFTGLHNNYHRPSDDFELVNLSGMARIATMATGVVEDLATMAEAPKRLKITGFADVGRGNAQRERRAVLGIQLDLEQSAPTVAEVTAEGPAAAAGLQAGDVIAKIGDSETESVEALRAVLAEKKPGDQLEITVSRDSETQVLTIVLGEG